MRIKAVDFFCGAGGLTRGLLKAGIEVLCGIDQDTGAKKTYQRNNKGRDGRPVSFLERDIAKLSPDELDRMVERKRRDKQSLLLFAACPPCQYFSKIRTSKRKRLEERRLLLDFAEFIETFLPEYVFIENVPGIRKKKYGAILPAFLERLKELGYDYDAGMINAKFYDVPQNRVRMVVLASLRGPIQLPHVNLKQMKFRTVRQSIAEFPSIKAGEKHPSVENHVASRLSPLNLQRIHLTPQDGGSRLAWSHDRTLALDCYNDHSGHTDVYGRMTWDSVAPTLTTRFNSFSNGRFGHPEQDRAISLREGAALQTFPNSFVFLGNQNTIARHIGNAFPVKLAYVFGRHIVSHALDSQQPLRKKRKNGR